MPTKPKRTRSAPQRSPMSNLAGAQADVLAHFDRLIVDSLGPLLGKANLARVRGDIAIVTNVAKGVVVHAGIKPKGAMTDELIAKEMPIVGVLANSFPLLDPASLRELKPGAYVVRLRSLGGGAMAFDFFSKTSQPDFSVPASPTNQARQSGTGPTYGIDADLDFPWDPDSMYPPPDWGTSGRLCLSFLYWRHCWSWDWPEIRWPW
jgi:hypothetical protein